ncbi:hypothetical protein AB0B42_00730 [Streptomyces fradiae]|uniref:hypothetical protein n=1 Tax=Streptomyces fradiae TaxID=1906 RepID=UPI0033C621B6
MAIPGNLLSQVTESVDPNTSGWVAKLNCTIGLGTGGRNGDGCLRLTSSAAGEMQARTVAAYPVTPGTEYQAFADASGATVPDRIGIRWLSSTGTEVSVTWSVTTASASASWHRISVAGIAPAGATQAQVVVSAVTPAAAGVLSYFENVYLGLPHRTTGNMLSFNAETLERDAAGWEVDANATISRSVPVFTWAVDFYLGGGHTLAMQVTASGNASVRTVERPAAEPGHEYFGYVYLSPPTGPSSNCWVEMRFYDGAGVQLSATRSTLDAGTTGVFRQRVAATAPAGTATVGLAAGITGGTAGQVLRIDGAVITVPYPMRTGSVLPYADASFEQGVAGWQVVSGTATLARLNPWGTDGLDGSYAAVLTSATASTSVLRSAKFPLGEGAGGLTWLAEIGAKVTAGGFTLTRAIRFYDAADTDLGASPTSSSAVPSPGWWVLGVNIAAPANATQAAIEWTLTATAASSVLRLDRAALTQVKATAEVVAVDESAHVRVTLRDLPAGDLLTLWRITPDGQRTLVRGASGLIEGVPLTADVVSVEDYEAPLGVAVRYYAETRTSAGALSAWRNTLTVTLAVADSDMCWLKDPGNPRRNVNVMVVRGPDWQRPIEQSVHRVQGRRNAVIYSGTRGGYEGSLVVWTRSDDEADRLDWLLDSGAVLLWQTGPDTHERDRYVSVGAVALPRIVPDRHEDWREWTLPLVEQDMPTTVGVAGSAGRTWQDVRTVFATWDAVRAAYGSWEGVLLDERGDA